MQQLAGVAGQVMTQTATQEKFAVELSFFSE
jgi:hypothetical protein